MRFVKRDKAVQWNFFNKLIARGLQAESPTRTCEGHAHTIIAMCLLLMIAMPGKGQMIHFRGSAVLDGSWAGNLPIKPQMLWHFFAADGFKCAPIIGNKHIVAGSVDGTVYALNMDGKLAWKLATGNSIEGSCTILNGKVFVGNLDGKMFCIDETNGKILWTFASGGQIMAAPNIWQNGKSNLLIFGSYDFCIYALNASTGKLVWKLETENYINGTPAIWSDLVVCGGCDGFLHVINVKTGRETTRINIGTYVAGSTPISKGKAWVGDYEGGLHNVDIKTGKMVWTGKKSENNQPFIASPSVVENLLIVGCRDKNLYAFDCYTGNKLWTFNTGMRVDASATIAGNSAIVGNMKGDIFIIDVKTGRVNWQYALGTPVNNAIAVANGRFVVAGEDGGLYCFGNK